MAFNMPDKHWIGRRNVLGKTASCNMAKYIALKHHWIYGIRQPYDLYTCALVQPFVCCPCPTRAKSM